jgi:hypothetical protein
MASGDLYILSFYHITISISHLMKRRRCLFLMFSILRILSAAPV